MDLPDFIVAPEEIGIDVLLGRAVLHKWALGCPNCQYGIRNYYNQQRKEIMSLYLDKLAAFQAGDDNLCDCRAGESARRWCAKKMENMRLEKLEFEELQRNVSQRRYERLFNSLGAPEHLVNYKFADYCKLCNGDPGKESAIKAIQAHFAHGEVNERKGIMLYGKSDRGKTGALVPLFTHYLKQYGAGLWIQYNELIAQLKQFDDGQVEERIKELQIAPLLFIDDLGDPMTANGVTDYVREVMFRVIDQRSPRLTTFVTSNLSPSELSTLFHERLVKRIGNLCALVEVGGSALGVLR